MPSIEVRADVPIALLYQQAALHEHLKHALGELGANVVYDAPAARFDRAALAASGARVVVVNLDPEVEEELEHLYELLEDDTLNVIFNDAEVSSRLEGWDQARWARHLAAKILGLGDTNPPRPAGAEAVAVRVRAAGPERAGVDTPSLDFDLGGAEFDRALHADTAESLSRTRAQLMTSEEPIPLQLIGNEARFESTTSRAGADTPTLELPRPALSDDRPTLELPREAVQAAAAESSATAADDEFAALSVDFAVVEPALADGVVEALDSDLDELAASLDSIGIDTAAPIGALAVAAEDAGEREAAGVDDEFAGAFGAFDAGSIDDTGPLASGESLTPERTAASVESVQFSGEHTEQPLDEALADFELADFDAAPRPAREDVPLGLDELLQNLPKNEAAGQNQTPTRAPSTPAAAPPERERSAAPPLTLAEDGDLAPPPPAPARTPQRDLSRLDLSHLSLAPLDDETPQPIAGRAQFRIDASDRAAPAAPAQAAAPARAQPPAPTPGFDDGLELAALDFDLPGDFTPRSDAKETTVPADATRVEGLSDVALDPPRAASAEGGGFFAGFEALLGSDEVGTVSRAASGAPLRCWVLGASIGGPDAVREFLAQFPADAEVVFLLAQHMGADFLELMTQQLARATALRVRSAVDGDYARPGEVIVVPLDGRLLLATDGRMQIVPNREPSPYSPSIDQVLRDVADRFGAEAGAIIFSGMAHDAVDGARYLAERGGTVWAQDPATCVISSMVDGAVEAGVVSVIAAPAELGRRFIQTVLQRA